MILNAHRLLAGHVKRVLMLRTRQNVTRRILICAQKSYACTAGPVARTFAWPTRYWFFRVDARRRFRPSPAAVRLYVPTDVVRDTRPHTTAAVQHCFAPSPRTRIIFVIHVRRPQTESRADPKRSERFWSANVKSNARLPLFVGFFLAFRRLCLVRWWFFFCIKYIFYPCSIDHRQTNNRRNDGTRRLHKRRVHVYLLPHVLRKRYVFFGPRRAV